LRLRLIKNLLATLFISQGVPMLLAGDECRRSQQGNNNAYCQDNTLSWFDWKLVEKNEGLVRFCRSLIHFRRNQPAVRRVEFPWGEASIPGELPDVMWFGPDGRRKNWSADSASLTSLFTAPPPEDDEPYGRHVLTMMHAGPEPRDFALPSLPKRIAWRTFVDTRQESPGDIYPDLDGPRPEARTTLDHHSMVVLVSDALA
jgi:glycogen operon protein